MTVMSPSNTPISAIKASGVRIRVALISQNATSCHPWIADAVGPGVVRIDGNTARGTTLNAEDQAVIAGRTTRVHLNDVAEILAGLRIFQTQAAALVRVGRRRAGLIASFINVFATSV